ncbi:major facilitator superfamily domain-containing protein [Dactylonectria macrodidyma]|uniref:Major facilitator superfamily domain-containing protein n=1 Tax=Dactylonectria macrodidyma TaxID=307937 RepID=A0A9P9JHH0_9HYPO|nr:major facilitator superfamily domain-containing protein [Dactylonectria macrodidyma]
MGLTTQSASDAIASAPDVAGDNNEGKGTGGSDAVRDTETDLKAIPEASSNYQAGVRHIEAITTVWTKRDMIIAYALIWLIYFIASTQEVVTRSLNPFVTSSFSAHSLTAVTGIISSLFGGLSKLVFAKIMDTWGRPQTILITMLIWTIGFILMAASPNVEAYVAAQVFSVTGAQGVSYCLTVFISDTSSLVNRPLMLAFATSPYIVTTWLGGPMADSIIQGIGFRWGFGIWTIVIPIVVTPLAILFFINGRKAEKFGIIAPHQPTLSIPAALDWCVDTDLFGIVILTAGMALFLLPMSIYSRQPEGWNSPMIISMIVVGGLLIVTFVIWEKFFAPVTFIPFKLLADRTVFFGGIMFTFVFWNSAIWGSYFTSMLLVVWNTGVTKATYISNIYRVGSCFSGLVIGYLMARTGRFKWVNLYFAAPLMLLGVGLMIQFRQPDSPIGYVIMTQILVAFAGGPVVLSGEMAMMAPSDHQHIAVLIAILDLFGSIGTAVGSTVAAAIWTGTFRDRLVAHLPPEADVDAIYSSMYTQLAYRQGTEIRHGIALAYGDTQRYMLIASVCILSLGWFCVFFWRDIKVTGIKQVRGNVA